MSQASLCPEPIPEPGKHYLCAGYRKFFMHIRKYLHAMTTLLGHGLPVTEVMKAIDGPLLVNLEKSARNRNCWRRRFQLKGIDGLGQPTRSNPELCCSRAINACQNDLHNFCADIKPGEGRPA